MKPLSLFAITAVVLSSGLWAEEPFRQLPEVQEAVDNKRAPAIAVRDLAAQPSLRQLVDIEANDESIQSILRKEETKTAIEKLNAPIVLNSMEEANRHLTRDSMERIADAVDFEKEKVVVFAWQGSGQDLLHGFMNQGATFNYTPGMTKDLRTHSSIYVVPKDATLTVAKTERQIIRFEVVEGGDVQVVPFEQDGNQFKFELKVQPAPDAE